MSAPVSSSVSQTGSSPAPGGEQPHEQLAGLRRATGRAAARTRAPAAPRSPARARRRARPPRPPRAAAAAGRRRAGPARSSTTSPRRQRDAGRQRLQLRAPLPRTPPGRASTASTRRQVSRERWVSRRPISRTWRWAAALVVEPEPRGECLPQLGRHPVGGAAGEVVHDVADVEQRLPAALEVGVRHVDQPGGHERAQHRRVAQAALGLLEVGHREVGELADQLVPRARRPRAARAAGRGRRAATGRARSCAAAA